MAALRWIWNPSHYWASGLILVFCLFVLRETWALASGRPQDSLSAFAWRQLHVVAGQTLSNAGAAWYLSLGGYLVVASWLAWHIWGRKYT